MKKLILLLALFTLCASLWAGLFDRTGLFGNLDLQPLFRSADAGVVQDYLFKSGSYQINADVRLDLSRIFQLRIPVNVTFKKGAWMADAGLMIAGYPIEDCGFNAGINLIQAAYRQGKYFALNELVAGWTINFRERCFIEPQIAVRDPSGAFKDEYAEILGIFPCYKNIRVRLLCGISI